MTKAESDLIIAEQNKSTEEILKAVAKVKSDYHELCKLKDKRIAELEDKLANTDYQLEGRYLEIKQLEKENAVLEKRIERAKECMKKLLFIINSEPANYNCKGLVKDAEDFIYNQTCNIRQQGQHCISETRCIMCDK